MDFSRSSSLAMVHQLTLKIQVFSEICSFKMQFVDYGFAGFFASERVCEVFPILTYSPRKANISSRKTDGTGRRSFPFGAWPSTFTSWSFG